MVKKMLINACHSEEVRVAVVADGLLEELDVQINAREATLGNIYKGAITRVEPSLQAVFVDYGAARNGFLSINDVHPSYFPESFETTKKRPRIQDVFKKDAHVIVQVSKEERSTKGASLTTNVSLAGRYLVLMPGTDLFGVSRKIEDEKERKKLKELLKQLKLPDNIGFIVRTAGLGRTKTELARDLDYVLKLWRSIEKNVADKPAPALLHREHDVVIRAIREHFSQDICEILVDEKEVHRKVRDFFHEVMPKYESLVKLYQEKRPLFNKYQLEEQIDQVYHKRIKLKSGGYIVIEPTEAMVSVDVNSGGAIKEKGVEETAFRVNMEAGPEIARQLRLRDLGGIITIDFIDMTQKKHKQEVERAVRTALKSDRAKTKVLRISALGLLELSRQRIKSSLGTGGYLECPMCDGAGKVRSIEMSALSTFRRVKSLMIRSDVTEVRATVPPKVAEYLLNTMRAQLVELERQYAARATISVAQLVSDKEITVEAVKEEPPEVSVEPPQLLDSHPEVPLAAEEEAAPEGDKKRVKKPSRRRRRSKKKSVPAAEGEISPDVVASEQTDAPETEQEETRLAASEEMHGPEQADEEVPEPEAEELIMGPSDSLPEPSELSFVPESPFVIEEEPEEDAGVQTSDSSSSAESDADPELVCAPEPSAETKESGTGKSKEKSSLRKSFLERYLPFS